MLMCVSGMQYETKAESAQIKLSSSATTCEIGSEITVTISITASSVIQAYDLVLSYNANILEFASASNGGTGGGGKLMWMARTEETLTVKFKTKATGKADLSASFNKIGVGADTNPTKTNGAVSITVNPKYVASTNNNLASLTVGGAALSPAFAANTTAYSCNVAANVSTLVVTAKQADSKAKVAVTGNTNLKYGRNEIVVTVTAESGATKRYVIVCNRATPPAEQTTAAAPTQAPTEAPKPKVIVNDSIYYVSVKGASSWPAGFTAQNLDYKGNQVVGGYNEKNNMYLMQLEPEGGEAAAIYIYDAEKDVFTKFVAVDNVANNYIVMPIDSADKALTGFNKKSMKIAGNEVEVYSSDSNYGIFYGMDADGNIGWYRFCSVDNTIQKYIPADNEEVVVEGESESGNLPGGPNGGNGDSGYGMWKAIALVALCVAIAFLIAIIALIVKHKKDMDEAEFEALYAAMPNKTGGAKAEFAATKEQEEKSVVEPKKPAEPEKQAEPENVVEPEKEETLELFEETEEQSASEETVTLEVEETLENEDDFNYLEVEETKDEVIDDTKKSE